MTSVVVDNQRFLYFKRCFVYIVFVGYNEHREIENLFDSSKRLVVSSSKMAYKHRLIFYFIRLLFFILLSMYL